MADSASRETSNRHESRQSVRCHFGFAPKNDDTQGRTRYNRVNRADSPWLEIERSSSGRFSQKSRRESRVSSKFTSSHHILVVGLISISSEFSIGIPNSIKYLKKFQLGNCDQTQDWRLITVRRDSTMGNGSVERSNADQTTRLDQHLSR